MIYSIGIGMEQSPRIGIGLEQSTKQYRLFGIGIGRTLLELVNKFVWYSGCCVYNYFSVQLR